MNLDLNYEPLWLILKRFLAIAVVVVAGLILVKSSVSDIEDKFKIFLQTIKDSFEAFRN